MAQQEMDFLIEARNAGEFYKLNQDVAYVTCPQIHSQVTTSRVLVMEYIEGFDLDRPDILTDNGYDLEEIRPSSWRTIMSSKSSTTASSTRIPIRGTSASGRGRSSFSTWE